MDDEASSKNSANNISSKVATEADNKRLWLGNLDSSITEFQLVKILQKYGPLEKFDMMYHKSGPNSGLPRGYAFVSYRNIIDGRLMKQMLSGQKVGSRHIIVKWAHTVDKDDLEKHAQTEIKIPALVGAKQEPKPSREAQIRAIESKLKMMEQNKDDLTGGSQPISIYQQNINRKKNNQTTVCRKKYKPYNRRL